MVISNQNNNYLYNSHKITFKSQNTQINRKVLAALQLYKHNPYTINEKLRGVDTEKLTTKEKNIINWILSAPRKTLDKDTLVYRGVARSQYFDPQKAFNIGEIYHEKGFTALTPKKSVAINFREWGYLLKVFLPKNTEYLDIDSVLIDNIDKLSKFSREFYSAKRDTRHEWVLFPGSDFLVKSFSKSPKYTKNPYSPKFDSRDLGSFKFDYILKK